MQIYDESIINSPDNPREQALKDRLVQLEKELQKMKEREEEH